MGKNISPLVKRSVPGMTHRITALPGTHGCILSLHSHTGFPKNQPPEGCSKTKKQTGTAEPGDTAQQGGDKAPTAHPSPSHSSAGSPASSSSQQHPQGQGLFSVCFPNFSAANQASWKEKKQKTEGRRKGAGGWELTLCGQAVHLHEMLILPRQGQS